MPSRSDRRHWSSSARSNELSSATGIPARITSMLTTAVAAIKSDSERAELGSVVRVLAKPVWQAWLSWRPVEDNRPEHEPVVLSNVLKIAEAERLSLSEKRIAAAFCLLHDTCFIPRITEAMIRAIEQQAEAAERKHEEEAHELRKQATHLRATKDRQRDDHMAGGARNARFLLTQTLDPASRRPILTDAEIERCVHLISKHDLWKKRHPYPRGDDRLAVACLEGDALWPLHPLGALADLERPDTGGLIQDASEPGEWRCQLKNSLETLLEYRANWNDANETFQDGESIFRTPEGHRLYNSWRQFWGL